MTLRPLFPILFITSIASLGLAPAMASRAAEASAPQDAPIEVTNDDCLLCHGTIAVDGSRFARSVHGELGLSCTTCHADLEGKTLPHEATPAKVDCSMCHEDQVKEYETSVHAASRRQDPNSVAATCVHCHTAHETPKISTGEWRLNLVGECGTCHADRIKTYRDTFHGQITSLGFARVAKCSDCHGSHAIQSQTDERSMVSDARRLSTCQTCHPTAAAGFAKYDPHADKDNVERNPELFYASRFMHWLLIGVFGFFGIHALLWLPRSAMERRRRHAPESGDSEV